MKRERARYMLLHVTGKVAKYLDALVREEGYGNNRTEVARTLIWRGIFDLIAKGILRR